MCFLRGAIMFSKSFGVSMPVGRVNDLNPLGHCGHLKLQEVVGSIPIKNGMPNWWGFETILE